MFSVFLDIINSNSGELWYIMEHYGYLCNCKADTYPIICKTI